MTWCDDGFKRGIQLPKKHRAFRLPVHVEVASTDRRAHQARQLLSVCPLTCPLLVCCLFEETSPLFELSNTYLYGRGRTSPQPHDGRRGAAAE